MKNKLKEEIYKALCFYIPYGFKCRIGDDQSSYSETFTGETLEFIRRDNIWHKFKIIGLRPVDSISIKEMKEAATLFVGGEVFNVHEHGITMVHQLRGGPDVYPEFILQDFFNLKYGKESLDWILSKGFDIFGLIEEGYVL